MSVHYKFKSTLHFDTITFDGLHISVGDLKREIIQQKRLGKIIDFDLQITNAQTKEEYKDDGFLIPKNTTLIISRIPIAHPTKKGWDPPAENAFANAPPSKQDNFNMDLSKMQGSEEDKIQAMMMQSTADYDPKTYHRIKGQSQVGEVPASYRCNKCKKSGHWIKNCPYILGKDQYEVKRNTGIPRSFRDKPDMSSEQETSKFILPVEEKQEIPEDLICGICRDIFVDAVMIPCCGSSFCDDCVRTSLLESEDSECPDCKEKNCSPGSLIPNRFLRNSVNVFKSETGYKLKSDRKVEKAEKQSADEIPKTDNIEKSEQPDPPEKNEEEISKKSPPAVTSDKVDVPPKEKDKYDSDYEDNITIKMPQKNIDSTTTSSGKVPPLISEKISADTKPHRREHSKEYIPDHDMKPRPSTKTESGGKHQNERSLLPTPVGIHHNYQGHVLNEADETHRIGIYKPPYIQMPRLPPLHMIGHHMPAYNNGYNNIGHRPPMSFVPYQNQSVHPMRPPYESTGNINMNPSQTFPSASLASIYQGVAAKVGSGLIDDPLEAFNRIMKEKERKKVERRRSTDHHRSRSPDRQRHRFKSPVYEKDPPRDLNIKEKRARSRDRKRDYGYERRPTRVIRRSCNGSKSPSDKIKRSGHRRSPTPKAVYKTDFKDKSYSKPYGNKVDPVEPPPPGFESSHLPDNEIYKHRNKASPEMTHFKSSHAKKVDDEIVPRKRHRSSSRNNDLEFSVNFRSLTPPTKSYSAKIAISELHEPYGGSPKTPEKRADVFADSKLLLSSPRLSSDLLDMCNPMGKENKLKLSLQLKERKKKKKLKSERKKNKKDKKEKKDKPKKVHLPDDEPTSKRSAIVVSKPIAGNSALNMFSEADINPISKESDSITDKMSPACAENIKFDQPHNDSTLDIEAGDIHFDEESSVPNVDAVHISKWELDDSTLNPNLGDLSKKLSCSNIDEHSEITSDVIRKAENAIFAKAINAIRPVEFQVVINSKGNSKDRSVSIRSDPKDRPHSPKRTASKSIKDRLGSKVAQERSYSPDRSKGKRRESAGKNNDNDDKYRGKSDHYSGRKRDRHSKERASPPERRHSSQSRRTHRSNDKPDSKDQTFIETNKNNRPFKERSKTRYDGHSSEDLDRNGCKNQKSGEGRVISSVASRPRRPDNPFRKSSNNLVLGYDNTIQLDVAPQSADLSSDYLFEQKRRKEKKLRKHLKSSSTESLRSEKRKDLKSKKRNKIVKKKKKSKK